MLSENENKTRYKYGAPMLVRDDTKERINNYFERKSESYDKIINKILDIADKYQKLDQLPEFHKFLAKLEKENKK